MWKKFIINTINEEEKLWNMDDMVDELMVELYQAVKIIDENYESSPDM